MIEILDGYKETINYDTDSSIMLYHNKEYEDYPPHWHTGVEIIMPLENGYQIIIDNHTYHLKAKDIIFIHSGVIHALEAPPTGYRIILQFDLSVLYNLKNFDATLLMLPPVCVITPQTHSDIYEEIYQAINIITKEYDSENVLKEVAMYSTLIHIYLLLCRYEIYTANKFHNKKSAKQQEYIEKFLMICSYINDHYMNHLTLDEIASIAGFSKFHFSRMFKEFTNLTFYEYLNQRRISKAESLLSCTKQDITSIAMGSGFKSISSFNRTFKEYNGCSPTEYRKKMFHLNPDSL